MVPEAGWIALRRLGDRIRQGIRASERNRDGQGMARNGYISSRVAITRLTKIVGDRREATRLIREALVSEMIGARGQRQIYGEAPSSVGPDGKLILQDISQADLAMTLSRRESIHAEFWREAEPQDRDNWDLEVGFVVGGSGSYEGLAFREHDVSQLGDLHRSRDPDEKEVRIRRRRSRWEEWTAALVCLGCEGRINAHSQISTLRGEVEDRLAKWGLDLPEKPQATVDPYLREVVRRLASHPPDPS